MKNFYRKNDLLKKYEMDLFNSDDILNNAMDLKLDTRIKYLIHKADNILEIEKRENTKGITNIDMYLFNHIKIKIINIYK